MEPTEVVVAYAQCPRKAYLLLFSPDRGEPHEYAQILGQQRCEHQERYLDRLQQTHAEVQPYTLEHLRNVLSARFSTCATPKPNKRVTSACSMG